MRRSVDYSLKSTGKASSVPCSLESNTRSALTAITIAFIFSITYLQHGANAASSDSLKKGMQLYNKKDYKGALPLLEQAKSEDPYNAELHYYLANTFMFLKNGEAAMKEYCECFELDPLGTFGQYSRKALNGFGKKFRGFGKAATDGKKHVAPDDSQSVKQALKLIKGQSCERDNLHKNSAEAAAKTAVANGEERDHRLTKAAQELADELASIPKQTPALQEEIHEIQQKAVFEGQRARLNAQQEATMHMQAAALRSTQIENSASSLLSLISESPKPGRVKVKAAGTNLYVRNYDFEPAPPLVPLTANWELMPELRIPKLIVAVPAKEKKQPKKADPAEGAKQELTPKKQISGTTPWEQAFIPGSSKIMVTDSDGKILIHVKEQAKK